MDIYSSFASRFDRTREEELSRKNIPTYVEPIPVLTRPQANGC